MNKDPGNITEFSGGKTGACGPTAYEEARAAVDGRRASDTSMLQVVNTMAAKGWASTNGVTTLADLGRMARLDGYQVLLEWDYGDPHFSNTENWHQVLLQHAGINPCLLFLENGGALKDVETGAHDEVGLHGHFISVLDKQVDGYRCSDGDNPQVEKRYCIYSYQALINAQVSGILVLGQKAGKTMANREWPGIGSGITAELNSHDLPADYVVRLTEAEGGNIPGRPDEIVTVVGNNSTDLIVGWNRKQGRVETNWGGHILVSYVNYAKQLEAEIADLKAQLAQTPTSTPAPAPAVPAELHNLVTELMNATQPFADLNTVAKQIAKEMNY